MRSEDGDNFSDEAPFRFVILALFHICSQTWDNSPLKKSLGAQLSIASVDDVHNSVYNELPSDVMHSGIQIPLSQGAKFIHMIWHGFFNIIRRATVRPMEYPCWNDETAAEKQKHRMQQFSFF